MNAATKPPVDGFKASIPSWRVRQLRTYLQEVAARAAVSGDDGSDIEHRAARRWFGRARSHLRQTQRKGTKRTFPQQVLDVMWKAIVPGREAGRSTKDIHADVVSECEKIGEIAPSITTIHTWRWHVCPEKTAKRLGLPQALLPLGETVEIGNRAFAQIVTVLGDQLKAPQLTSGMRKMGSSYGLEWRGLAFFEPAIEMWWIARPSMYEAFEDFPEFSDENIRWYLTVRENLSPDFWLSNRLRDGAYRHEHAYPTARQLGEGLLAYRKAMLPYVIPLRPPAPAAADSDFARSLADIVINAYAAARNAPGGPVDLEAVIKWRLGGKDL